MAARSWLLGLAVACALAGCGRWGFDASGSDGGGDGDLPDDVADASAEVTARAIEIATFTTTSPSFVDIPGAVLTIPPSPGQTWALFASATLQSSSLLDEAAEVRYLVDGIERGLGGTESITSDRPGPWQHFYVLEGTDTPIAITFQLRDREGATTVIEQLHAVAAPLPADSAPLYASADPIQQVATPTFETVASLMLTPAAAGDHIVFLLVTASERPGGSNIDTQWLDPTGQSWSSSLKNPRGAWQSNLLIRRVTLGPGPVTLALQAYSGATAQLQYVRALALRVDALGDRFAYGDNVNSQEATVATPSFGTELRPTLGAAPRYLVIGTTQIDDDCGNSVLAERNAHFLVEAETQVTRHAAGNCSYETTYGMTRLWPAPPSYVAAGYSSNNGQRIVHKESALVVLGVD